MRISHLRVERIRPALVVEHDRETKRWSAVFPELPGCASAGDTEEEAVRNAKEGLALWFAPSPEPLPAEAKVLEVALSPGTGGKDAARTRGQDACAT